MEEEEEVEEEVEEKKGEEKEKEEREEEEKGEKDKHHPHIENQPTPQYNCTALQYLATLTESEGEQCICL